MKRLTSTALLCIGALFSGALAPSVRAIEGRRTALDDRKIGTFETAPPLPAPVNLALNGRSAVRVFLRVRGLQKEPATFILRGEPQHGTAKLLPQISREWAEVEYTPPKDREITSDSFRFVVSNSKGTSSESIAVISIKDIGPRLEVPHHLNFGLLQTGQARELPLEIRNSGDMTASGSLSLSGEWSLPGGAANYEIPPGESALFSILLAPHSTGSLEGEVRFSSETNRSVFLLAKVEDWIHATPDPLLLRAPQSSQKISELILTNQTELREWIQIDSEPALSHPYAVWLEPTQTLRVPVSCANHTPLEQVGKLTLHGSKNRQRVLLWRTAALGPALGGIAELHSLVVSGSGKSFKIWNEGGRAGKWGVQTSDPFKFSLPTGASVNAAEITLAPGESTQITVTAPTKPLPKNDGALLIRTVRHPLLSGNTLHSIALTVKKPSLLSATKPPVQPTFFPGATASKSFKDLAAPTPEKQALPEAPYFPPAVLARGSSNAPAEAGSLDRGILRTIRNAFMPGLLENNIYISHRTWHSVRLTLPAPTGIPPAKIAVFTRLAEITGDTQLKVSWKPIADLKATLAPSGQLVLDLDGLPPASNVGILIAGPPQVGGRRTVLNQFDLPTPPRPFWLSPRLPWFWVLTALLGFLGFLKFQRRPFRR